MANIEDGSNPGLHQDNEPNTNNRNNENIESIKNQPEIILLKDPNSTPEPTVSPKPDRWDIPDQPDHIPSNHEIPTHQPTEIPSQPQEV